LPPLSPETPSLFRFREIRSASLTGGTDLRSALKEEHPQTKASARELVYLVKLFCRQAGKVSVPRSREQAQGQIRLLPATENGVRL
jgi:hypothetical protein